MSNAYVILCPKCRAPLTISDLETFKSDWKFLEFPIIYAYCPGSMPACHYNHYFALDPEPFDEETAVNRYRKCFNGLLGVVNSGEPESEEQPEPYVRPTNND